jgi:hypothetical protein
MYFESLLHISFFFFKYMSKILATIYCDIDKACNHTIGTECVLLLGLCQFGTEVIIDVQEL